VTLLILCLLFGEPDLSARRVKLEIASILAEPAFHDSVWGVVVAAPARDRVLFERNPSLNFRPASNLKILTTVMAMDLLGPDYRFETELGYTGTIRDGVLTGDLIITGRGDPSISSNYADGSFHTTDLLAPVIEAVRAHGIREVAGDLIARVDFFDDVAIQRSWEWDDLGYYYAVPVTPLSLHDGWIEITLEADEQGVITTRVWPEVTPDLEIYLDLDVAAGRQRVRVKRPWGTNRFTFTGNLPPCGRDVTTLAAWDPNRHFLAVFRDLLEKDGIAVRGVDRVTRGPIETTPIDVLISPPLAELAATLMKVSQNHYADLFLKTMAAHHAGEGSFEAGAELAATYLTEIVPGPGDRAGQNIRDGSGLSAQNYIKPRQLAALLDHGLEASWRDDWLASLAVMGADGTLSRRGVAGLDGRVWAKTGYIYRSRNLSGYVETHAGEPLVFVLLANNYSCPTSEIERAQDRICAVLRRLKPNRKARRATEWHYLLSETLAVEDSE